MGSRSRRQRDSAVGGCASPTSYFSVEGSAAREVPGRSARDRRRPWAWPRGANCSNGWGRRGGIARLLKVGTQERLVLIAAGAGAGLAAAFNAPLAGLIFVLEELQRDFRPMVFGAAFIAAATAD